MKFKPILLLIIFGFTLHSCNRTSKNLIPEPDQYHSEFRIVGYYSLNAALSSDPETVPFDKLTHINLWFFNPDSLGNYTSDLSPLEAFIKHAHDHNVQVLFSIGGGGHYPHYSHLLKDDHRSSFIKNLVAEVLKYNLDGVDVDLEGSAIDENYEPFVVELAHELRKHQKKITAAIAVYYKDQFTDRALAQYDFVNIMVYDRTGPWRPDQPGHHSTFEDAVEDLLYFGEERNIPSEKMVLGVPFYGYAFSDEPGSPVLTMNYNRIIEEFSGAHWSDEWELGGGYTIHYNGIPTMKKKTELAREKASGIMIWQLLGDSTGEYSLLKAIYEASR